MYKKKIFVTDGSATIMKAVNIYAQFLETVKYLLKEIDYYGSNQFKTPVAKQEWTIGKFYDFLMGSTLEYYIPHIKKCLAETPTDNKEGKKTAKGKFLFWYGRVPAVLNYKDIAPYTPIQPENPNKAKDNLFRFVKIMNKLAHEIDMSNSTGKSVHPDLGQLSALEWYKLIEINFKYHLKTKYELDKVVRSTTITTEEDDFHDYIEEIKESDE